MFDGVFVINMDRSPEYLASTLQECQKMGFHNVQRWRALDAEEMELDLEEFNKPINRINRYTKGCHALRISTINLLEHALEQDCQSILVLEDDVYFSEMADKLLPLAVDMLPVDWEVLNFGCYHFKKPSMYAPLLVRANGCWFAQAIAFSRVGMRTCLDAIRNGFRPADLTIGLEVCKRGNVYAMYPNIAFQHTRDSYLTGIKNFETLIPANPFDCKEIIPVEELLQIDPSFDLSQILNTLPY